MDKERRHMQQVRTEEFSLSDEQIDEYVTRQAMAEFQRNMELGLRLWQTFKESLHTAEMGRIWVTIRPGSKFSHPDALSWEEFYDTCRRLVNRKCFTGSIVSFEQKGTTVDTMGTGYHMHWLTTCRQRSMGELRRDMESTLRSWIDKNWIVWGAGIKVVRVKTQEAWDNRLAYIRDYSSIDNHKMLTKDIDAQWRAKLGVQPLYEGQLPVLEGLLPSGEAGPV